MIDLRYLGLTLIGVFLALAIGLMTGSALGSPDRQAAAYQGLRNQFELLRTENTRVRDDNEEVRRRLEARDRALTELLPLAVRNRLSGGTVAVILCGPVEENRFWRDLESAIRLAGARIGPVVRIPDRLRPVEPQLRTRFNTLWGPDSLPDREDPFEPATWVARALIRGPVPQRLETLAQETGIELRGVTREPVKRLLVIVAAPDEQRAARVASGEVPETRVVDAARAEQAVVVAAEPEQTVPSAVDPLRHGNVSTVDNIDTAAGQIAAVLALAGAQGHYGSKRGATRALPALEAQ